jgi:serine phosphatase RsbU (regulator of sigma subunit)
MQKEEISRQRDEIKKQHEIVVEHKKEIDDSIRYAKRIQTAVLPADKYADSILGEHFIIFRPKDVVSGDFYWATKTDEWTVVTAADCTGHGVPGAFMSMLGISFLNEIVSKKELTNTGDVLNYLRKSVIDALKQTGGEGTQKDGMDMSLVAIHKDRKKAMWSGANNPLLIIRKQKRVESTNDVSDIVEEIKPDKMPVAVHVTMDAFSFHEFDVNEGDRLYLFSDGLPDQFGGEKGKKFLYKRFKQILVETSNLDIKEQGNALETELDAWMNFNGKKYEQVDDITVIGLQI